MATKIELYGGTMQFMQDGDDGGINTSESQLLEIGAADAGAGKFYYIKTERWAFDNIKEFEELLIKFKKAFNMELK